MFDKLMDEVIKRFGFEAEETILFCQLCEDTEKEIVKIDIIKVEDFYRLLMED